MDDPVLTRLFNFVNLDTVIFRDEIARFFLIFGVPNEESLGFLLVYFGCFRFCGHRGAV